MPPQSVVGDTCLITGTHCHVPHPATAPGPPAPCPGMGIPMTLVLAFAPTVMACVLPCLTKNSMTPPMPCHIPIPPGPFVPVCVPPIGTGRVNAGSGKVKICGQDAARLTDATAHIPCDSGTVPSSGGKIMGPGAATVIVGG
jgi:hypothetical protein